MAKIYGTLSSESSEKKVRSYLDKYLNDDWIIYQNFNLDRNFNDGQVDFLILHQTLGGFVLEVKGGGIETSLSKNGNYKWFSIDRNNKLTSKNLILSNSLGRVMISDIETNYDSQENLYFNIQLILW